VFIFSVSFNKKASFLYILKTGHKISAHFGKGTEAIQFAVYVAISHAATALHENKRLPIISKSRLEKCFPK
jgi:hypothetical protein